MDSLRASEDDMTTTGSALKLLTIPRSELDSKTIPDAPVQLLKLPKSWTLDDLKGASFVARPSEQAILITQEESFYVHRVETSNALILVPPKQDTPSTHSDKKQKVAADNDETTSSTAATGVKPSVTVPVKLLKMGGVGASFLELRPKKLRMADLISTLHTWDPYCVTIAENPYAPSDKSLQKKDDSSKGSPKGNTVAHLALALQVSEVEVRTALRRSYAYAIPHSTHDTLQNQQQLYCRLSEQIVLDCERAIISTLNEVANDYAGADGVGDLDTFVQNVEERCTGEDYSDRSHVIRHVIKSMGATTASDKTIRLDVSKVAACVARRLFQKQSAPWEEEAFFVKWQSDLPGVGKRYQVTPTMLLGLAVKSDSHLWQYLPADSMATNASACFDALFSAKEKWLLHELEPYLQRLEDTGISQGDLLLQHTKLESEERDGITVKLYMRK